MTQLAGTKDLEGQIRKVSDLADRIVVSSKQNGGKVSSELEQQAWLEVAQLRGAHKDVCIAVDELKEKVADDASKLDYFYLTLQSKLYELGFIDQLVKQQSEVQSKFSAEDLGLMAEDDFWNTAPTQFTAPSKSGQHHFNIQRLAHEQWLRQEHVSEVERLRERRIALQTELEAKQRQLAAQPGLIDQVNDACKALFNGLGIGPIPAKVKTARALHQLPEPLYVLYHELEAAIEANGLKWQLQVAGSQEEALADGPGDSLPDSSLGGAVSRKRQRSDGEDPGDRKRSRGQDDNESLAQDEDDGGGVHPLYLITKQQTTPQPTTPTLQLTFHYHPTLRLLSADLSAVGSPPPEHTPATPTMPQLRDIFPEASAVVPPRPAGGSHPDVATELAKLPGSALEWVQLLGGLPAARVDEQVPRKETAARGSRALLLLTRVEELQAGWAGLK